MAGRVRERMDAVYHYILSENEYGLLKAMFLGDKTELSSEEKHLYEENGYASAGRFRSSRFYRWRNVVSFFKKKKSLAMLFHVSVQALFCYSMRL